MAVLLIKANSHDPRTPDAAALRWVLPMHGRADRYRAHATGRCEDSVTRAS